MTSRSLRTVVAVAAIGLFSSPVLLWALLTSASGEAVSNQPPDAPAAARIEAVVQVPAPSHPDGGARGAAAANARIAVEAGIESGVRGRLLQDGKPLAAAIVRSGTGTGTGVETTSDADGTFAMGLPIGEHRLAVLGPRVARGFTLGKALVGFGGLRNLGEFEVPRGGACAGRVLDEREQPVVDALVWASGRGLAEVGFDVAEVTAVPDVPFVRTGADGRFHLEGLRPGELQLRVEQSAYVDRFSEVCVEDGGCVECGDIVLACSSPLHGIVVDGRGQPVPGAMIVIGGARQHSPLQRRRAATAAADGTFMLPCFGVSNDLTVFADRCEPLATVIDNQSGAPVRLVLAPANVLQGKLLGSGGRPGTLQLHWVERSYSEWPAWVKAVCNDRQVVGVDGAFCIPALPKGRWRIGATIPGVGIVPERIVELPTAALQLELAAARDVVVQVVDDLGAPVVGAVVARASGQFSPNGDPTLGAASWFDALAGDRQVTDATGTTSVRVPCAHCLMVAARSPTHVMAATAARADVVPERVTLVLQRGAVLEGSLADASLARHVSLTVVIARLPDGSRTPDARTVSFGPFAVDCDGRFRVTPLPPGRIEVRLQVFDTTGSPATQDALPAPVPWLGDAESLAPPATVELVSGETTIVKLAPKYGQITGRVMARGEPVARALVFVRPSGEQARWENDFRFCCEFSPHCRTGADGTFRFFVGPNGGYELLARHERGGAWGSANPVTFRDGDRQRRLDIVLHAASIRGSIDLSSIEPQRRQCLVAQLYPLAHADRDPFEMAMGMGWQASNMPEQRPDSTGAFAYECVPSGRWVLRIGSVLGPILVQRIVQTVGDEVHDLGRMSVADLVDAHVATGAAQGTVFRLMQAAEGSEHGAFVAALVNGRPRDLFADTVSGPVDSNRLELGRLEPGRYHLLPFRSGSTGWSVTGEPCGQPVDIVVAADGAVTPAVVWPDGVK